MIRVFTLFSLFFICSSKVIGSEYYWMRTYTKEWKKSNKYDFLNGKLEVDVLNSLDSIYSQYPNAYFFFNNGNELQSFVSCGFDLYSINETSIERKYNFFSSGYTCNSTPFVRDETNYLIGGYGFWTHHLDLLKFDEIHGSWELVKTINQPVDYFSKAIFQNSKGIFSLFGSTISTRTGISEIGPKGYFLDWETKEWRKIEIQIEGIKDLNLLNNSSLSFQETRDYLLMVSHLELKNVGWNIIEKESGKIYYYDSRRSNDVFLSPFIEVIGNTINFQSPNGTPISLDLKLLISQSKEVGSIIINEGSMDISEGFPLRDSFYIITIILLILLLVNVYVRKKSITTPSQTITNGKEEIKILIESFSQYSGQTLNTEQLDELLGLDKMDNNDSKRLKRSRWINKLNEYYNSQKGRDLIERDKNPQDKRYMYYRINC